MTTHAVFATNHDTTTAQVATRFVCDDEPNPRHLELEASVKSGEYFLTLATVLDHISADPEMQQIIQDLIYLQRHYKIIKK